MNTLAITSVKKELVVDASQATAFKIFTEKIDLWWPRTYHVGSTPMTELVLESAPNGRWYSKHEDGSEVNVGYVLTWQPYDLLVLNWQIDGDFKCNPDLTTEVEVQFVPEGPAITRVKFEHKNLDRLGSGDKTAESMDEGWGMIMELYKKQSEKNENA